MRQRFAKSKYSMGSTGLYQDDGLEIFKKTSLYRRLKGQASDHKLLQKCGPK